MIKSLLNSLANFSWTAQTSMVSILLFGEYPYPSEERKN